MQAKSTPSPDNWFVHKNCPSCLKESSVSLHKQHLVCQNEQCDFAIDFLCPICDHSLQDAEWIDHQNPQHPQNIDTFKCKSCKSYIPLQKILYLIDNAMVVDQTHKCSFCNGPTLHRADMNISHRCFFFPKCSGQVDLFGAVKESLVFLDFETTGLEAGRDQIIEIGAIKIDEDGYEHVFQTFVKPTTGISEHITQITGITDAMVANAPPIAPTLLKLMDFIGSAKIVAHNVDFDLVFLLTNLLQFNLNYRDNDIICTLRWARQNGEGHCSLGALSKKYAIRHNNAHRALADAVTTKELFFIFDGSKKSPRPQLSFQDFIEFSQKLATKYPVATAL